MDKDDTIAKKNVEDPQPKPMLDCWKESSEDFKAYPPKKKEKSGDKY